jgi:hypothetical protein
MTNSDIIFLSCELLPVATAKLPIWEKLRFINVSPLDVDLYPMLVCRGLKRKLISTSVVVAFCLR